MKNSVAKSVSVSFVKVTSVAFFSEQSVKDWTKETDPVKVMGKLRKAKDGFKIGGK